jgi:hypothetical protein
MSTETRIQRLEDRDRPKRKKNQNCNTDARKLKRTADRTPCGQNKCRQDKWMQG